VLIGNEPILTAVSWAGGIRIDEKLSQSSCMGWFLANHQPGVKETDCLKIQSRRFLHAIVKWFSRVRMVACRRPALASK
jgi:hypothetical protein